ncbi:MAG: hypothetical protein LBG09_00970 [Puniceicoccales bacterium]|nr:hypothetical protein [Puniceicoccales bacterium]
MEKFRNFCYYFYRIGIRFLLVGVPIFLIHLAVALIANVCRGRKLGESR